MENLLWYLAKTSVYIAIFCSLWCFFVWDISGKQDRKSAETRNPNYVVKGKKQCIASMVIIVFLIVYIPVTGLFDTFVYIAIFLAFSLLAFGLWSIGESVGSYAFVATQWRRVRSKSYLQALAAVVFIFLLEEDKTYLEQIGVI